MSQREVSYLLKTFNPASCQSGSGKRTDRTERTSHARKNSSPKRVMVTNWKIVIRRRRRRSQRHWNRLPCSDGSEPESWNNATRNQDERTLIAPPSTNNRLIDGYHLFFPFRLLFFTLWALIYCPNYFISIK